jgi:hypothetical protein
MFNDQSPFSFIATDSPGERQMTTVEALSTMDNEGVT